MYQKYHTDALVLGSRERGEADRVVTLYTRDFGLILARASAVRRERSKMRYALQNYSQTHVALVRGKRGWRIAGTRALCGSSGIDQKAISAFARISELMTRLIAGEETQPYLFDVLREAHNAFMSAGRQNMPDAIGTIELVCVARVLYALGYISVEALGTALFTHTAYADIHLREAETMRNKLLASINSAIPGTHL